MPLTRKQTRTSLQSIAIKENSTRLGRHLMGIAENAVDCNRGKLHRLCAVNCKWEEAVLPNAAEKIGSPRYRPERPFVMSWKTLRQISRQTRNRSPKASEMRETSSGQALARSVIRRSRRHLRHVLDDPAKLMSEWMNPGPCRADGRRKPSEPTTLTSFGPIPRCPVSGEERKTFALIELFSF
jgi:hypothetical protein